MIARVSSARDRDENDNDPRRRPRPLKNGQEEVRRRAVVDLRGEE